MASPLLVSNGLSSSVVLPRGYVFAPTDSELFCHFLLSKIQNPDMKFEEIHDLDDIYKYTPEILANYSLCKIYQRISKASTIKSSTVIGHQSYNNFSDVGDEGGLEDYIMPQLPYYEDVNHGVAQQAGMHMAPTMNNITNAYDHQYINIVDGADQGGTINCEEAMPPLMIIDQDHPSAVPFIASNFGLSNIEPDADPEEAGAIIQDYQQKYQGDFNTDHPDVVAPPNVESTEVLEEEGLDWLRDFPKFQPADLEFSDWDNEFAPV
ncbi:hypothetical protein Scep_020034 [Stephania cephalantha]|uniref:NAC domain-containing protein n=1 Tax=Stephania cephalantha TaxID=152367 RepID=A0AAP0ICB2_9MAGN